MRELMVREVVVVDLLLMVVVGEERRRADGEAVPTAAEGGRVAGGGGGGAPGRAAGGTPKNLGPLGNLPAAASATGSPGGGLLTLVQLVVVPVLGLLLYQEAVLE